MFFRCVLSIPDSRILAGPRSALTKHVITTKRGLIASRGETLLLLLLCRMSVLLPFVQILPKKALAPLSLSVSFLSPWIELQKAKNGVCFPSEIPDLLHPMYNMSIWRGKGMNHYDRSLITIHAQCLVLQ